MQRQPLGRLNHESSSIVVTFIKWSSSAWYTYFSFIYDEGIQSQIEVDDRLWTSNASFVARLFQNSDVCAKEYANLWQTSIGRPTTIKQALADTPRVAALWMSNFRTQQKTLPIIQTQQLSTFVSPKMLGVVGLCWRLCANGCNNSRRGWNLECIMEWIRPIRL